MQPTLPLEHRQAALDAVLRILNEGFKADPGAMHALCSNRVPCNAALALHPSILVGDVPTGARPQSELFCVGAIGLLNGVVEALTGERVAQKWTDEKRPTMLGFCRYQPPETAPKI